MFQTDKDTIKRTLLIGVLLMLLAFIAFFIFSTFRVFFLIFAAVLIAVFLDGCGDWLSRRIPKTSHALGIVLTILSILAFFSLSFWWIAPHVRFQLSQLQLSLPRIIHELMGEQGQGSFRGLLGSGFAGLHGLGLGNISTHISHWIVDFVVVVFISVYLAFQPSLYRRDLIALVPPQNRQQFSVVLGSLRTTMWRWFIGRLVGMAAIGLMVGLSMWGMGMPLAFALGFIAGVFEFVPYLGAFVSSIPAVLLALDKGPTTTWLVIVVYLIVHGIDGYVVLPLVERRAVHIAPGLTIAVQLAMFITMGILGVLIADPLTACILVLLQRYYIS